MRFDSWLIEISATPAYLLIFFLFLIFLLDIILVRFFKLDDISWKKVDYIWLSATALGLIASSSQANHFLSKIYLEVESPPTAFAYRSLRSHLENGGGVCSPRIKSPFSPQDFELIVKEQQFLCKKTREMAAKMPKDITPPFPLLEKTGFLPMDESIKYETYYVNEINQLAQEYRVHQERYTQFKASLKESDSENIFKVIGPLILSFALALRITKVSGELTNAKRKLLNS